jgi:cell cycle serine/threonine-protein kinase CDC5/MSD2
MQLSLPPSYSLSLYLSLTGEQGAHTLFIGQRKREKERERERKREKERERERKREKEIERNREKESEKEEERIVSLFLAPFSYLVY